MMKTNANLAARLAAAATLCAATAAALVAEDHQPADHMETRVTTADGRDAGIVTFTQAEHGVLVSAKMINLTQGAHGFHIHETGACSPDFDAAGGHFNPGDTQHGFHAKDGYHAGDMPNIKVGEDGTARAEFFVPHVTLGTPGADHLPHTLADKDGSAIMIHAEADDYRDIASAGARVACGVIFAPRP